MDEELIIDVIVDEEPIYIDVLSDEEPIYVDVIEENVIERVVTNSPFTKTLSGFTDTIDHDEHGLSVVRGLRVCKPTGEAVELKDTYDGTTVTIESNVLLDDHILTIY